MASEWRKSDGDRIGIEWSGRMDRGVELVLLVEAAQNRPDICDEQTWLR